MTKYEAYTEKFASELHAVTNTPLVARQTDEGESSLVVGSPFAPLIPIAVELLATLLQSCIARFSDLTVARALNRMGPWQRANLRRAIQRNPDIKVEEKEAVFEATIRTNRDTSVEEWQEIIAEARAEPTADVELW